MAMNVESFYGKLLGNPSASAGGHARAKTLSKKTRSQIAKKAAIARWGDSKQERIKEASREKTPEEIVIANMNKHITFFE